MSNLEPRALEFVGRLHMLLVHFPIALVLTGGFVELVGRGRSRPSARSTARWCLGLGALAAVLAAISGWIHADQVPTGRALSWTLLLHRSAGIATALAASMTWLISRPAQRVPAKRAPEDSQGEGRGYRIGLLVSCALVGLTGHLGGTLVHGRGFLFGPLFGWEPSEDKQPAAVDTGEHAQGAVFTRDVQPIFEAHCYKCHGPRRQKGHLRLDRLNELLQQPEQTVIVPGDPDASEAIQLVSLPAGDLDVMPAEGDPLTAEQIETLRRWIANGALLPVGPEAAAPGGEAGASPVESEPVGPPGTPPPGSAPYGSGQGERSGSGG